MKKIFSIILIFVIIFLHITVYAEYKLRYEELPQTESILAPDIEMNEKNWIFFFLWLLISPELQEVIFL